MGVGGVLAAVGSIAIEGHRPGRCGGPIEAREVAGLHADLAQDGGVSSTAIAGAPTSASTTSANSATSGFNTLREIPCINASRFPVRHP